MPSSSSTAWVAASPPPLPAGMTLCGHAGVSACVSMSAWQPGSCASVQPGSEGETCSTLHKKCKCRCSGPPGPGGSRCCCCISPIPFARGGRAAKPAALASKVGENGCSAGWGTGRFSGEIPALPAPLTLGSGLPPPAAAVLTPPGRQVVCKLLRAWGGESHWSPGCEGRDAVSVR